MPSPTSMHAADLADVDAGLELLNFLLDDGSDLVGFEFHGHSCRSSVDGSSAIGWRSSRRRPCRRRGARRRRSSSGSTTRSSTARRRAGRGGSAASWPACGVVQRRGGGQPHADAARAAGRTAAAPGGGSPGGSPSRPCRETTLRKLTNSGESSPAEHAVQDRRSSPRARPAPRPGRPPAWGNWSSRPRRPGRRTPPAPPRSGRPSPPRPAGPRRRRRPICSTPTSASSSAAVRACWAVMSADVGHRDCRIRV